MKIFLLVPALLLCAGIALGFLFPPGLSVFTIVCLLTLTSLAGIVWGYKTRHLRTSDICGFLACIFLGMVLAQKEKKDSLQLRQAIRSAESVAVEGIVEPVRSTAQNGCSVYFLHSPALRPDPSRTYSLRVPVIVKDYGKRQLQTGGKYILYGKLRFDRLSAVPQAVLFVRGNSEPAVAPAGNYALSFLVRSSELLRAQARHYLSDESFAFFSAFFFGKRELLTPQIKKAFKLTGTYHILSISGLHIAALYLFIFYFFKLLRVPYKARLLISLGAVGLYCLMAGNSVPTQRSFFTIAVFVLTHFVKRRIHPLQTLSLVFLTLLIVYPWSVFDIGFWLSFSSVFFIIAGFIAIPFRKKPSGLETVFYTSVFAFLGTTPITVKFFNTLTAGGILVNMLIVPLSTLILFCGILSMLLLCSPPLAALSFLTVDALIKLCIFIAVATADHSAFFMRGDRLLWWAIIGYYLLIIGIVIRQVLKNKPEVR